MNTPDAAPLHRSSVLARLQQGLTLSALLAALLWALMWHSEAPGRAAAGAATILLGYALVLALEFGLMAALNRRDPAPPLGLAGAVAAWWREVRAAPAVFSWRQPFCWRRWPDASVPPAPGARAVVLVHGFVCNRGLWLPWLRALHQRGLPYATVNLEPVFGSIDQYRPLIDDAVRRAHALTGRPPLLVCHSMGGLAARSWLAHTPGAAGRVCGVMTIGTPHHGTWLARFGHTTNGRQMRPGGPWLRALAEREAGQPRPPFLCWYSHADNIVFPASNACLAGADNRHLSATPHVAMAVDPAVMAAAFTWLETGAPPPAGGRPAG